MGWITKRLKEKSTWIGLIGLLGSIGIHIDPNLAEQIITWGTGAVGMILVVTPEK